jgi:DNA (cytosine-5)-methyltransferase 1
VFVVGCLGNWESAAKVLFESESLSGNTKSSRKARKETADSFIPSVANCLETTCNDYSRADGFNMIAYGFAHSQMSMNVIENGACPLMARDYKEPQAVFQVYENHPNDSRVKEMGEICQTVTRNWGTGGGNIPFVQKTYALQGAGATSQNANGSGYKEEQSYTLNVTDVHGVAHTVWDTTNITSPQNGSNPKPNNPCHTLAKGQHPPLLTGMAVRRLTEVECERLQGFPDNYTNIKENCPSGARYKALGNSMAVPVMKWIGNRINEYERGNL